jgi:hypothetical protein
VDGGEKSSAVHISLDEVLDIVEIALLADSVVVVAIWQLLPDASLGFADFEKLFHVCRPAIFISNV